MNESMVVGMLQNAAMLLAMAYLYDLVFLSRELTRTRPRQVLIGLGVGLIGLGVMVSKWELLPGVIFDTRSVLLGVSGLFFGTLPTAMAMLVTGFYRWQMGGAGAVTGVAVVFTSGLIGLAWRRRAKARLSRLGWLELYGLGLVVHVAMLLDFLLMPAGGREVLRQIVLPVLVIYPAAFALLGRLMSQRLQREELARDIRESESRYRSIFENPHTPMLIIDPENFSIVEANPQAAAYYGWPREVLRTMRISDINTLPPHEIRKEMDLARAEHRNYFNFRHRRANGRIADVEVFSGPIEIGGRVLLLSIVHDITLRRLAEQGLQQAEKDVRTLLDQAEQSRQALQASLDEQRRLAHALDQSPASVVITDPQGAIVYVNRTFTQVTGYERAEALGQNPRILKSGDTPSSVYEELWATISAGRGWQGELRNRRKDGQRYWERAVISPVFDEKGRIENYIAVKVDTTAERALQEQFRQAQKMEAVGRLAGGVAHDFNNMLQAILGYADMALDDCPEGSLLREGVLEIRKAAQRSANLTRQLLAFARKQAVQPQRLDLNESVSAMLKMLRRLIGEDVELVWKPGPVSGLVTMDPGQVDQILANLSVNARDAMPDGGQLTIATRLERVDSLSPVEAVASQPGDFVVLEVADTGVGMSPKVLDRVFEPFFTTKAEGKGTGLGLATVYGIVKQNGGFIRLRSEVGRGTAFAIYLPRGAEIPDEEPSPDARPDRFCGTEAILLVEDEPAILRLAEMALLRCGYTVLAASNALWALNFAREHRDRLALLITDVVMPDLNGRQLKELVEAEVPGIKVLYISGYTAEMIEERGVLGEGIHFLPKPFTATGLAARVREVLDA